jgi:phosphoribosyl-AMP cyclohydrolase
LYFFSKGVETMPSEYSLSDVLGRLYENQEALQAAIMELALLVEEQGAQEVGGNVRGALWTMGENAGHIKQGLARLKKLDIG